MTSELFAKYQFGAKHTVEVTPGKVMIQTVCSADSHLFRELLLSQVMLENHVATEMEPTFL